MERKKASDFDPDVLILFDAYVHGAIDRRGFLDKASKYAVGGVTAAMLLDALNPRFAEAQQVAKDDARIKAEYVTYPSPQGNGTMKGYLVRPANAKGKLPGVLVVHENRGLNPHIEDIARRLALDNFVAFAPDALTPLGGYPGRRGQGARALPQARPGQDARGLRGRGRLPEGPPRLHRQGRRRRLLLRRRHRQHARRRACRISEPRSRSTGTSRAPRTRRRSRRRCSCTTRRATSASTPGWPAYEAALKAANVPSRRCTCTRARSTASTTTRRRATTRPRRSSPGSARSSSSTSTSGDKRSHHASPFRRVRPVVRDRRVRRRSAGPAAQPAARRIHQPLQRQGPRGLGRPPGHLQPLRAGEAHARRARRQEGGVERRPRQALAGRYREGRDRVGRPGRAPGDREGVRGISSCTRTG